MKKWIVLAVFYGLLLAAYLGLGIADQVRAIYIRRAWTAKESPSIKSKSQDELKKISNDALHPATACCTDKVPVPRDHPPLRILASDGVYSVVYAPHDWLQANHSYAMTDEENHLIVLDRLRNPILVRQDVVHELMHIAFHVGGGKRTFGGVTADEEEFIGPMAEPYLNIMNDNPELVKWLMKTEW